MNEEYKEGYIEALSDLHLGYYEDWVTEEKGDYYLMAEYIIQCIDYCHKNNIKFTTNNY